MASIKEDFPLDWLPATTMVGRLTLASPSEQKIYCSLKVNGCASCSDLVDGAHQSPLVTSILAVQQTLAGVAVSSFVNGHGDCKELKVGSTPDQYLREIGP